MVALRKDFLAIGIDVETHLDEEQSDALARDILVNAEHERFLSLPKEQRSWLLTLTFSLKESLYKALYPLTGTQFYFEHAELLAWSADGSARLRLLYSLSEQFPAGTEVAGHFCALDGDLLSYVAIRR
ncbi:4'-phosphopantetheinyl transferase superfamily protein [compost metagenome]